MVFLFFLGGVVTAITCGSSQARDQTCATAVTAQKLRSFFFFFFFGLFGFSGAASAAYGGSQARGGMGAIAAGLLQSHSNEGSELCLRPTPQHTAMPDP